MEFWFIMRAISGSLCILYSFHLLYRGINKLLFKIRSEIKYDKT